MALTENETTFLLWAVGTFIGVFAFIGILAVNSLIKMSNDLTEIKISVREVAAKHEATEKRVTRIENHVFD
jgi:beta-lactamase regulating signal transducer with metallopeptidase domain